MATPKYNKALIIVDVQNDFCPGGSLAVKHGDSIVPMLNRYIDLFVKAGFAVFASRDWHPRKTRHFKEFGGSWPVHCVQNTSGALFHPQLQAGRDAVVVSKGMDPQKDSYSVFQAVDENGEVFSGILSGKNVKELFVGGLATDYCVKATVMDALEEGFTVNLLADAVKGVDFYPGDAQRAIKEMLSAGAIAVTFEQVYRNIQAN